MSTPLSKIPCLRLTTSVELWVGNLITGVAMVLEDHDGAVTFARKPIISTNLLSVAWDIAVVSHCHSQCEEQRIRISKILKYVVVKHMLKGVNSIRIENNIIYKSNGGTAWYKLEWRRVSLGCWYGRLQCQTLDTGDSSKIMFRLLYRFGSNGLLTTTERDGMCVPGSSLPTLFGDDTSFQCWQNNKSNSSLSNLWSWTLVPEESAGSLQLSYSRNFMIVDIHHSAYPEGCCYLAQDAPLWVGRWHVYRLWGIASCPFNLDSEELDTPVST